MDFFAKNIEVIRSRRPFLFKALEPHLKDNSELTNSTQTGFNLRVKRDAGEGWLYEPDFKHEFERSLSLSKLENPKIVVWYGFGLGEILDGIGKLAPQALFHVVVEKNPVYFIAALRARDLTSELNDARFEFFVGLDQAMMIPALKEYFLLHDRVIYAGRIGNFFLHSAMRDDGAYYVLFAQHVKESLNQLENVQRAPDEDAYYGFMNLVGNLKKIPELDVVNKFKDKFTGKPAVIVSSGPSLGAHLDFLKKYQDRFVVACSDSSLKLLNEKGIEPHFVFCLERSVRMFRNFEHMTAPARTHLVTLPIAYPKVLECYHGPVLMLSREMAFGKWLWPGVEYVNVGSHVASMALRTLVLMGCREIYFLGQDLAYDPVTKISHTNGINEETMFYESKRLVTPEYCELPGNSGQPVPSTIHWKLYGGQLENMIARYNVEAYNVIPKEYGAKIANATQLDPAAFWQETVPALPRLDLNLDCESPTQTELIKRREALAGRVNSLVNYLTGVEQGIWHLLEEISETFHHNFPESNDAAIQNFYVGHFKKWDEMEAQFMQRDDINYTGFLKPFVSAGYYRLMTARENVKFAPNQINTAIFEYVEFTREWLKTLACWAIRCRQRLVGEK